MPASIRYHGRNAAVYVDSAAGASTSISGDSNEVTLELSHASIEVTGFGHSATERLHGGLLDGSISVTGFYSQGATAAACLLTPLIGASTYLQVGLTGSTSACQKFTASVILDSVNFSAAVGDAAGFDAQFVTRTGSITASTW